MRLRFWGVRGSCATSGTSTAGVGGNTACVQLEAGGGEAIVFDAGTGIRELGLHLNTRRIHLFLTHFHWDHIQGLPFFAPLFDPANHVTIYSSRFSAPLKESLVGLMAEPYFPVTFDTFKANVHLVDLGAATAQIGDVSVRPFETNHPQGACGYRAESRGISAVYCPDREHGHARLDRELIDAARDADVLMLDSQYTPEEYESHRGWGHSTWTESIQAARDARVKRLVLFHHDPSHNDEMLRIVEQQARREFPETYVAREGWSIDF